MILLLIMISRSLRWMRAGALGMPPYLLWAGIGWLALTIGALREVYLCHSLALFPQIAVIVTSAMAYQCFLNWQTSDARHRIAPQNRRLFSAPVARLLRLTPVGVAAGLLSFWLLTVALSHATFAAILRRDFRYAHTLHQWGGRLQEEVQGKIALRSAFGIPIADNDFPSAHVLLETGLDPTLAISMHPTRDPKQVTMENAPFLFSAALWHRFDIVSDLLAHGADPNATCSPTSLMASSQHIPSDSRITSLFLAVQSVDTDMVHLLVTHGAIPQDNDWIIAKRSGYQGLIEALADTPL